MKVKHKVAISLIIAYVIDTTVLLTSLQAKEILWVQLMVNIVCSVLSYVWIDRIERGEET